MRFYANEAVFNSDNFFFILKVLKIITYCFLKEKSLCTISSDVQVTIVTVKSQHEM